MSVSEPVGYVTVSVPHLDAEDVVRIALYEATFWRGAASRPPLEEAVADRYASRYVDGWGREGDVALAATDATGAVGGGVWRRYFTTAAPGYGFVAPDVPEVGLGLQSPWRGRGIGTRLLAALHDDARAHGISWLSLSVEPDNPAVRLYERAGYIRVGASGGSWTMIAQLHLTA